LRDRYDEIQARGAGVIAIGTGDGDYARQFARDGSIPYPILVDDEARAAHAASVHVASFLSMFHPSTWAATRDTWRRGYRIQRAGKRVTQLGATFVIAPGPRLLYEHLDADATNHASIDQVLAALP
jgi:peroxiredoxin